MDRETYETLSRIRGNPIIRDNPLDEGLTPDEESLVKAGLLDRHDINREHGTYTVAVSLKGREALDAMRSPCWLRRSWKWLCGLFVIVATAIFHEAVGAMARIAFDGLCSIFNR